MKGFKEKTFADRLQEAAEARKAALERLSEIGDPSLILLDLGMPRMDGWEFLSRLDRNRNDRRVPVVLLSGLAYIRDAPGVADFLAKPIRPDRLLEPVVAEIGEHVPDAQRILYIVGPVRIDAEADPVAGEPPHEPCARRRARR